MGLCLIKVWNEVAALPPAAIFAEKHIFRDVRDLGENIKRRGTSVRAFSRRNCGEISILGPNGEENVNPQKTDFLGERPIPKSPGGRRPTGSGGLGGEAPQWRASSKYYLYTRTPESLSRTKGAGDLCNQPLPGLSRTYSPKI